MGWCSRENNSPGCGGGGSAPPFSFHWGPPTPPWGSQLCPSFRTREKLKWSESVSPSSVHGILWARILEWVVVPFSGGSSRPRDGTWVSHIVGTFCIVWATREAPGPGGGSPNLILSSPPTSLLIAGACAPTEYKPAYCSLDWGPHHRSLHSWAPVTGPFWPLQLPSWVSGTRTRGWPLRRIWL